MASPIANELSAGRSRLIADLFEVDFTRPLPDSGGGLPAFVASKPSSVQPGLMAVQVRRGWPARHHALQALRLLNSAQPTMLAPISDMSLPLAHGPALMPDGEEGYFVVCTAPPGRPLSLEKTAWSEMDLITRLLRPAAAALAGLEQRGVTHRAIRASNVFMVPGGDVAWLGCAWAAPPGSSQPPRAEPPYSLICDPAAHGDGCIADDVYALGSLMIQLALGSDPLAGLPSDVVIQRKLETGSFNALLGDRRLPGNIAELVSGMVADDPEHRPSPALLGDLAGLRARRIAARPLRTAQRPLQVGVLEVRTARSLALAAARQPVICLPLLRSGMATMWLRRMVGEAAMATRIDEAVTQHTAKRGEDQRRADAVLMMSAVAILDPLAPLAWSGGAFWPDGIAPALDHAHHSDANGLHYARLLDVLTSNVIVDWTALRLGRADVKSVGILTRQFDRWLSAKPTRMGPARLRYAMNPLSPCRSPMIGRRWVTKLAELLPAIEASISSSQGKPCMVDAEMAAFLASRRDERVDGGIGLAVGMLDSTNPMSGLRLFAKLHAAFNCGPVPALANWIAGGLGERLDRLQSQSRREALARRLAEAVAGGSLEALLSVVDDEPEQVADSAGYSEAVGRLRAIDTLTSSMEQAMANARGKARRTGQDVAHATGMLAVAIALAVVLFG